MIKILILIILLFAGCAEKPSELPEESKTYEYTPSTLGVCTVHFEDLRAIQFSPITLEECFHKSEDLKDNGSIGAEFSRIYWIEGDFRGN
ncbi:MAG: hypothetical protein V3U02_02350 [Calditrichia bacterium]